MIQVSLSALEHIWRAGSSRRVNCSMSPMISKSGSASFSFWDLEDPLQVLLSGKEKLTPVLTLNFIIKGFCTKPHKCLVFSREKLAELQQVSRNKNLEKSLKAQQLLGLAQYSAACKNTEAGSWNDMEDLIFLWSLGFLWGKENL